MIARGIVTPDEELGHLDAELQRLHDEHPDTLGVLRLTGRCLRGCSKWKWERRGWTISDGQACGIMNGDTEDRRTALLEVLRGQVRKVEFVSDLDALKVVPDTSASKHA